VLLVFGLVLFAVFGWSIRGFLFKLPAFALYFGVGADLAVLAYMMAFALIESLIVTAVLVALAALLPAGWLRAGFAYKGFLIVLVATAAIILFEGYYRADFLKDILAGYSYMFPPFIAGLLGSILALGVLLWLFRRYKRLQRYAVYALEQISLFTYIYVPLGLIGLVVVLVRNLR
jgi:hypothetical protein